MCTFSFLCPLHFYLMPFFPTNDSIEVAGIKFWLKLQSEHFMPNIVQSGVAEVPPEFWCCSVLRVSCFCSPWAALEDGSLYLLSFQLFQGLFWHLLSLITWGKMKFVPTNFVLYRYIGTLCADPELVLAGTRQLWELAQPTANTVFCKKYSEG